MTKLDHDLGDSSPFVVRGVIPTLHLIFLIKICSVHVHERKSVTADQGWA